MALLGTNIMLYWYYGNGQQGVWLPFGCSRSHEINVNADDIETSNPDDGRWKTFLSGRKDWTITLNYLVLADTSLQDMLQVGNTFRVCLSPRNNQSAGVVGNAYIKTCRITATISHLVQGTFQFRGTGELGVITR